MGCCLCHSLAEVEQDPGISVQAAVGDIIIVRERAVTSTQGDIQGIMYVKDDFLYYETRCGSNLCCKCCRQSFKLSAIQSVEVAQNQVIPFQSNNYVIRSPVLTVLKITAVPSTLILVAVPGNVASFAEQLEHTCSLSKD